MSRTLSSEHSPGLRATHLLEALSPQELGTYQQVAGDTIQRYADMVPAQLNMADGERSYSSAIRSIPLLSPGEELSLGIVCAVHRELNWFVRRNQVDSTAYDYVDQLNSLFRDLSDQGKGVLIGANLRLVVAIARRYGPYSMKMDDRIQWGNLGLIKAAETFDPRRGRFTTIAVRTIRQAIWKGAHKEIELLSDKELPAELSDTAYISSDQEERQDGLAKVNRIAAYILQLTEAERRVIRLRFGSENDPAHDRDETAAILGIQRSSVRRTEQRAFNRIRDLEANSA